LSGVPLFEEAFYHGTRAADEILAAQRSGRGEGQRGRGAEEQRVEEQRSRGAEEQRAEDARQRTRGKLMKSVNLTPVDHTDDFSNTSTAPLLSSSALSPQPLSRSPPRLFTLSAPLSPAFLGVNRPDRFSR
jgi:hypothetical protein